MKKPNKPNRWGNRTFTPDQWLKRDFHGAQTVAAKAAKDGRRPITLPKLTCLTEPTKEG